MKHNYKKLLIESLKEAALIRAGAKATRETTTFESLKNQWSEWRKANIDQSLF